MNFLGRIFYAFTLPETYLAGTVSEFEIKFSYEYLFHERDDEKQRVLSVSVCAEWGWVIEQWLPDVFLVFYLVSLSLSLSCCSCALQCIVISSRKLVYSFVNWTNQFFFNLMGARVLSFALFLPVYLLPVTRVLFSVLCHHW